MIQTKFGSNWSNSFRGEDFKKSLRRQRTPSDGNSSRELKMFIKGHFTYKRVNCYIYIYIYVLSQLKIRSGILYVVPQLMSVLTGA